jgi:colanic acid biosynthesis protein WcaH
MLDISTFRVVVENAPLVSIDLCIICNGEILLGHRKNEPLKGAWFTPGGRILKNEAYFDCLRRVTRSELGSTGGHAKKARLMGKRGPPLQQQYR